MKKIKYLFLFILLILSINNVKAFDNTKKVYDYAQVLTAKEEKKLYDKIDKFIKKYNMDMVLVSVRYHEKDNSNSYAKDFYNINDFGIKENKDGVIFVIDLNFKNESMGLQTFGSAKKIINNTRIESIESSVNNIQDNYYDKFNSFIEKANEYASLGVVNSVIKTRHILFNLPWIKIILLSLVTPLVFITIYLLKNKKHKKDIYDDSHVLEGSIDINIRSDKFITTSTNTERK